MASRLHRCDIAALAAPEALGPAAHGGVLVHGDFGPQNLLPDRDTFEVTTIVDWEFAHLGDGVLDLAWAEWNVRTHHPHLVDALPSLFNGYGTEPAWGRRQAAMVTRCEWALDFVTRWSPATRPRGCSGAARSKPPPLSHREPLGRGASTIRYIVGVPVVESAAELLREARRRAGLTQAQLGQRAAVTQSVVSAYESEQRQPSLPTLLRLLRASGHALDASLIAIDSRPTAAMSGPLGQRLRRHRRKIRTIAASFGVQHVRVFGSAARGSERSDSDVDLLVDLPPGTGLFALGRLRRELEDLLGAPVDLVPEDGLKPEVRANMEADLVTL